MISGLIIPERVLEEIVAEGKRETQRDRETLGVLFGRVHDGSIVISGKYRLRPHSGIGTDTLYDRYVRVLYYPVSLWVRFQLHRYVKKVEQDGGTPVTVYYHSHPYGSYSPNDLIISDICNIVQLLYRADNNTFEAYYRGKNPPVSTL